VRFLKDTSAFFNALFHDPRSIGAVLPSSRYLANSMVEQIDLASSDYVVELGPGTGAITKVILKSIPAKRFITLEISPAFADTLQANFPEITVIKGNAANLSELLQNKKPVHTIISSLPLRSLTKSDRDKILSEIPKVLSPNGQFIQYSYSLNNKNIFYPKNFTLKKSFVVWRNIPPARVSVFQINPG